MRPLSAARRQTFPPHLSRTFTPLIVGICPLDKFLTFLDEKRFDKHFLRRKKRLCMVLNFYTLIIYLILLTFKLFTYFRNYFKIFTYLFLNIFLKRKIVYVWF